MSKLGNRIGPHSIDAEIAVLGAVFINISALTIVRAYVEPDDFFEVKHGLIFQTMLDMVDKKMDIDLVTLSGVLEQQETNGQSNLELIGGMAYLMQLINETPTHVNAETYARLIAFAAFRRSLLNMASRLAQLSQENLTQDAIMAEVEKQYHALVARADGTQDEVVSIKEMVEEVYTTAEKRMSGELPRAGLPTGYPTLDKLLSGLRDDALYLIAARPAMGKTALGLGIALRIAREGCGVYFVSLEMGKQELAARWLSDVSVHATTQTYLGNKDLDDAEWEEMVGGVSSLRDLPIYVNDDVRTTLRKIKRQAMRLKRNGKLSIIMIDYLQLLVSSDVDGREGYNKQDNENVEVGRISRELKKLARELHVPVVALSQLNRNLEHRADKRPILSDLRSSGSLEQDPDCVMMLYKPDQYDPADRPNQVDVIIAKQRNGPTGVVTLMFDGPRASFREIHSRVNVELGTNWGTSATIADSY